MNIENNSLGRLLRSIFLAFIFIVLLTAISDSPAFGFWMGIIMTVIVISFSRKQDQQRKQQKKEKLAKEAEVYFSKINKDKKLIEIPSSIFLEKGEKLLVENKTALMETKSVRSSSGGFGGVSIVKGVRVGGYSGTSSSSLEWKVLDSGFVYLTTKRIIFRGNKENRNIELKDIFAFDSYSESIGLSLNSKSKNLRFVVDNPLIWSGLVNILKSVENPEDLSEINLNLKFE